MKHIVRCVFNYPTGKSLAILFDTQAISQYIIPRLKEEI